MDEHPYRERVALPCRRRASTTAMILAAAALMATGCSVDKVAGTDVDAGADTVEPDTTPIVDTGPEVDTTPTFQACDRTLNSEDCPGDKICDTQLEVCVDCIFDTGECIDGVLNRCTKPISGFGDAVIGGIWEEEPCAEGAVCVDSGQELRCEPKVCEPLSTWCVGQGKEARCSSQGHAFVEDFCEAGRTCYAGQCGLIRHNVLLVMDTSGSMQSYITGSGSPASCDGVTVPCPDPFPDCDRAEPLTLLTQAKVVFRSVLGRLVSEHVRFALQRFPQQEYLDGIATCQNGWYRGLPEGEITGDDQSRDTGGSAWFAAGMHEAIIAPFPNDEEDDNLLAVDEWFDMEEQDGLSDMQCDGPSDCPSNVCGEKNGQGYCVTHSNHELRTSGLTPLGKSMFYAGEYMRRFVLIDGQPCATDNNCDSAGYVCTTTGCRNPWRECKETHIILFTDGFESQHTDEDDFFNPAVQAKRLKFGLDCTGDEDCRGGALCDAGICLGEGQDRPDYELFATGAGFGALASFDGSPISITTSVVTLSADVGVGASASRANAVIAAAGGGDALSVFAQESSEFELTMQQLLAINWKCEPEDIEPLDPATP